MSLQNAIARIADEIPGLCSDGLYSAAHIAQDPAAFEKFREEVFGSAFADQVVDALVELASRRTYHVSSLELKQRAEARSGRLVRNGAAMVALWIVGFKMSEVPSSTSPTFVRRDDHPPEVWLESHLAVVA